VILRKHHLGHLPELKVNENILSTRFDASCSVYKCDAKCCSMGVFADVVERDRILKNADLIRQYMEPTQQHDPSKWFEKNEIEDADFPSGRCIGTEATEKGCIFLQSNGRCVLQIAATEEGHDKAFLKPFFCFAYPVTVDHGELIIDQPDFVRRPQCCTGVPGGPRKAIDVCREELEFVLGVEGYKELVGAIEGMK
jgi:hypothetical protein